MARRDQPPRITPAGALQHWEGVADPSYLLAEINELRLNAGMGTLLEMAEIEARSEVAHLT